MPLLGNGLVAIWNDIAEEMRDEFFEWHPREHMQERMGVPGFRRGRRYISDDADIEFFTLYEASEPELLVSEVYRKRLANPTDWSLKVLPFFRNNIRGICRSAHSEGYADGGFLSTLRVDTEGRDRIEVQATIAEALKDVTEGPHVTGGHLLVCDLELSSGNESLQRGRTINTPDIAVLVEGSTADTVRDLAERLTSALAPSVTAPIVVGHYSLEYQVMNYTV